MALTRRSTSPSCQMVSVTGRSSSSLAESVPSRLAKRSLRVKGWESASSREKSTTARSAASAPVSSRVNCNPFISSRPCEFQLAHYMVKRVFSVASNAFHLIKPAIKEKPQFVTYHLEVITWPFFSFGCNRKYDNYFSIDTKAIKISSPFPWHRDLSLFLRDRVASYRIMRINIVFFVPNRKNLFSYNYFFANTSFCFLKRGQPATITTYLNYSIFAC